VLPPLTVRDNLDPMVLLDSVVVHWGNVVVPGAGTTVAGMGLVVHMPASDTHGLPAAVQVREPVLSTGDWLVGLVSVVLSAAVASTLPSFGW
jgi:hypothetical protein